MHIMGMLQYMISLILTEILNRLSIKLNLQRQLQETKVAVFILQKSNITNIKSSFKKLLAVLGSTIFLYVLANKKQ